MKDVLIWFLKSRYQLMYIWWLALHQLLSFFIDKRFNKNWSVWLYFHSLIFLLVVLDWTAVSFLQLACNIKVSAAFDLIGIVPSASYWLQLRWNLRQKRIFDFESQYFQDTFQIKKNSLLNVGKRNLGN